MIALEGQLNTYFMGTPPTTQKIKRFMGQVTYLQNFNWMYVEITRSLYLLFQKRREVNAQLNEKH